MTLNSAQDFVPRTLEEAVDYVVANTTEQEKRFMRTQSSEGVHHGVGTALRNAWNFWEPDNPLKRDTAQRFKIAHADDLSGLLLDWVWAKVRGEPFNPQAECQRFHTHWALLGLTSLCAGGWKDDASDPLPETVENWNHVKRKRT